MKPEITNRHCPRSGAVAKAFPSERHFLLIVFQGRAAARLSRPRKERG